MCNDEILKNSKDTYVILLKCYFVLYQEIFIIERYNYVRVYKQLSWV